MVTTNDRVLAENILASNPFTDGVETKDFLKNSRKNKEYWDKLADLIKGRFGKNDRRDKYSFMNIIIVGIIIKKSKEEHMIADAAKMIVGIVQEDITLYHCLELYDSGGYAGHALLGALMYEIAFKSRSVHVHSRK